MLNASTLIDAVLNEGQFDVSRPTVLEWANDRHGSMVAEAKWRKAEVLFATLVAGTSVYPLDASVVEVGETALITSADGSIQTAHRVSEEEVFELKAQDITLPSGKTAFAPNFDQTGTAQVAFWPVPDSTLAGATVTAMCALQAADLSDDVTSPLIVPADFHEDVRDGCIATGYQLLDNRPDLAAPLEQKFMGAIGKLAKRQNKRVGRGRAQARVYGYHFV